MGEWAVDESLPIETG